MGNFISHFNSGFGKLLALAFMATAAIAAPTLQARTVTAQEALQRAMGDTQARTLNFKATPHLVYTLPINQTQTPGLYVFGNADNRGFIIVPADDQARAILGYSTNGTFDPENLPESLEYWLNFYNQEIASLKDESQLNKLVVAKASDPSIAPLVKTTWSQDSPYNDKCPQLKGKHTLTGCSATVLAQIMKYFNYPKQGTGNVDYRWNGSTISSNFSAHTYEWDKMLDSYSGNYSSAQAEAVSLLMWDCAVSVRTDFGLDVSLASSLDSFTALTSYFGYDLQARYMDRTYYTTSEWEDAIYQQLEKNGPVYYTGQSLKKGGHAFVCDGYADGYFHINWGWGGLSDGYFSLSALDPDSQGVGGSSSGFNYSQNIITNIYPNKGGNYWTELVSDFSFDIWSSTATLGNSLTFSVGLNNFSAVSVYPVVGLAFTNTSDNTTTYTTGSELNQELPAWKHFTSPLNFTQNIPSDLNDGSYVVRPAYKDLSGDWHILHVATTEKRSYNATVSGKTVTFFSNEAPMPKVTASSLLTPLYSNCAFKGSVTLRNPSNEEFYGIVYSCFVSGGSIVGFGSELPLSLGAQETREIEYTGTCNLPAGQYQLCYCVALANQPGSYLPISDMSSITVSQANVVAPEVSNLRFADDNSTDINASALSFTFDATLNGGIYRNPIYMALFPEGGGLSIHVFPSDPLFLEPGLNKDIKMTFDISEWVEVGTTYAIVLYARVGNTSEEITDFHYITIGSLTEVTKVKLSQTEAQLRVGQSIKLTATVTPAEGAQPIVWTSSEPTIATVDQNGLITAKAVGEATITASSGDASAICKVTILPIEVISIELSQIEASLKIGESIELTATVLPEDTTDKTIVWTSSNPNIATVDQAGKVTAITVGETTITAKAGEVSATCKVTVLPIEVTAIELSQNEASLVIGQTVELTANVLPEDATDKTIVWTSSNPNIATVDQAGKVTAITVGETTITAKAGEVSATCKVTVLPIEVTAIELSQIEATLVIGQTIELTANVLPEDATDKTIVWTSSNPDIASVDQAGCVTALAVGEATITAQVGNISATCKVTVLPIEVTAIELSQNEASLVIGQSIELTANVLPEDATDKTVVWTSSNPEIAAVDQEGRVTAIALGEATITAKAGDVTATCKVSVLPIEVTAIELSQTEASLKIGQSIELTANVQPEDATDKTIVWTSSNPEIATVDQDGRVTAIALGEATITAKAGEVSATCKVFVLPIEVTAIELSQNEASLVIGQTVELTANVLPEDATDKTIVWTSSNPEIATVDQVGRVTALAVGEATITAQVGNISATCKVTVLPIEVTAIELSQTEASLVIGQSIELSANVLPEDATDKTVVWTSSNPEIAAVDQAGRVTAIALGEATITAKAGEVSATCKVIVLPIEVTAIELSETEAELVIGETLALTATVTPSEATDQSIGWSSSDPNIALVDKDGLVTAISEGTATIEAKCGNVIASCKVTVKKLSQSITWNQTFDDVKEGDVIELNAEASSNLPITYTLIKGDGEIDGNKLTVGSVGEITIVASQEGNDMYYPAEDVTITFISIDGILDIIADMDEDVTYYTISGIRVQNENLEPGFYIVKSGAKTFKVHIK